MQKADGEIIIIGFLLLNLDRVSLERGQVDPDTVPNSVSGVK